MGPCKQMSEVEIQVWVDPGELAGTEASSQALGEVYLHLLALLSQASPSGLFPCALFNGLLQQGGGGVGGVGGVVYPFSNAREEKGFFSRSICADSAWPVRELGWPL